MATGKQRAAISARGTQFICLPLVVCCRPAAACLEEVGALVGAGGHQEAAIRAALDGQAAGGGVASRVQELGTGLEIVKHILQVEANAIERGAQGRAAVRSVCLASGRAQ